MSHLEYGGYIELDTYDGNEYHPDALALNCGRNCLAYLIRTKAVKGIYLPYFICSSVTDVCERLNVPVKRYHIDKNFLPQGLEPLGEGEWLYLVNYYGQLSDTVIRDYQEQYGQVIVDYAQAFFQRPPAGSEALYTCRKFFGVADGAYLYTASPEIALEDDCSFERMQFLLGRYEKTANEFYKEYAENNRRFREEPTKRMSALTHNLLRALNYEKIAAKRTENFSCLHERFAEMNLLKLSIPFGAFMYPLYVKNGSYIRTKLQQIKIYIPTLWPDVFQVCCENDLEYDMAANILPLPVDQRYDRNDMEYIASEVEKCIS